MDYENNFFYIDPPPYEENTEETFEAEQMETDSLRNFYLHYKTLNTFYPVIQPPKKNFAALKIISVVMAFVITITCVIWDLSIPQKSPDRTFSIEKTDDKDKTVEKTVTDKQAILNPEFNLEISDAIHKQPLTEPDGEYTLAGIAETVMPSIVEIYNYNYEYSKTERNSTSSGIVITENGYILTNEHCVANSDKLEIITNDGKNYDAEIVGRDAKSDIAVIKVNAYNLSPAVFADSDKVVLGEKVAALGNPAGYAGSITNGIVSGLKRKIRTDESSYEMECFQTNAQISPGNSGGALVNMYGEVIGVVSSKISQSGLYEGLGFAITVNAAKPLINEIIRQGYISGRYKIGITCGSASDYSVQADYEEQTGYTLDRNSGVVIFSIDKNCRVSESGLREYDILIELNGKKITNVSEVVPSITGLNDKKELTAIVLRLDENGELIEKTITFYLTPDVS